MSLFDYILKAIIATDSTSTMYHAREIIAIKTPSNLVYEMELLRSSNTVSWLLKQIIPRARDLNTRW